MKKKLLISLSLIGLLALSGTNVLAATDIPDEGGTTEVYVTDEGDVIYYDNTAVNGGIDLVASTSSDKTGNRGMKSYPSSVELSIPFHGQETSYYCAPASAQMLLETIGYYYTQDELADMLGTSTDGTSAGNGIPNALNTLVDSSVYHFNWVWHTHSTSAVTTMKNHIMEALAYGNPVMINTMESPGDSYLIGHNIGGTLYHFGIIGDYFNYGESYTYVDPGYGFYSGDPIIDSVFEEFVMNQNISAVGMSKAAGQRGYVY